MVRLFRQWPRALGQPLPQLPLLRAVCALAIMLGDLVICFFGHLKRLAAIQPKTELYLPSMRSGNGGGSLGMTARNPGQYNPYELEQIPPANHG